MNDPSPEMSANNRSMTLAAGTLVPGVLAFCGCMGYRARLHLRVEAGGVAWSHPQEVASDMPLARAGDLEYAALRGLHQAREIWFRFTCDAVTQAEIIEEICADTGLQYCVSGLASFRLSSDPFRISRIIHTA